MLFVGKFVRQVPVVGLLASCMILSLVRESRATAAIVDTNGFESFGLGPLENHPDWVTVGQHVSTATVLANGGMGNSQSVQVNRGADSDDRWAMRVGELGFPDNRYILIDWDMKVEGTGATNGSIGPFLGVDAYDDSSGVNVLGSLGVDATTSEILIQEANGILISTNILVEFGGWYHFQIQLDFDDDSYLAFVNGTQIASSSFADGVSSTFTDADIATFATALDGGSQLQTATAHFDNFLVRSVSRADFDIDGTVDDTDLATWSGAYGSTAGGDVDLDGDTDGSDFLSWQRVFDGDGSPLAASLTAVPEPSTLSLLLFSLLGVRFRLR